MKTYKEEIQELISLAMNEEFGVYIQPKKVPITRPKNEKHGDWSSSIAFMYAKSLGRTPMKIASKLVKYMENYGRTTTTTTT